MPEDFVTLAVVKTLLESQANAFKAAMEIVVKDVKEEVRTLRNEVKDLTVSLQFTQAKMEESQLDSVTLGKTVACRNTEIESQHLPKVFVIESNLSEKS